MHQAHFRRAVIQEYRLHMAGVLFRRMNQLMDKEA